MRQPAIPLLEDDVDPDPLSQFGRWFDEAARVMDSPDAMALATADGAGRPSVRMVLLKGWDDRGFAFCTNYGSAKGADLQANPQAALLFFWDPCARQVRIDGPVERLDADESDAHFAARPRGSQVGAWASRQSRPVGGRGELDEAVGEAGARWADGPVDRPPWWGGFRVLPRSFEFWQHRDDRLHDRLRYQRTGRDGDLWELTRLQP